MTTWLRRNLFRSPADGLVTLVAGALSLYVIFQIFQFVFVTGRWEIIQVNLKLLLVGRFPEEQLWVVGVSLICIAFWAGLVAKTLAAATADSRRLGPKILGSLSRFALPLALTLLLVLLSGTAEALLLAGTIVLAVILGRMVGAIRSKIALLTRLPKFLWIGVWTLLPLGMILLTLSISALEEWGGFLINFYMAVLAIALCFPLGVLLALG